MASTSKKNSETEPGPSDAVVEAIADETPEQQDRRLNPMKYESESERKRREELARTKPATDHS